jgi:hypothetical protein
MYPDVSAAATRGVAAARAGSATVVVLLLVLAHAVSTASIAMRGTSDQPLMSDSAKKVA